MDRISTFAHHRALTDQALKTQARTAEQQLQVSSGRKSDEYAGIASSARRTVNLQGEVERSSRYAASGEIALSRVQASSSALSGMVSLVSDFRSQLSGAMSGQAGPADLNAAARGMLDETAALLNTRVDGRYLFGGSCTDAPPVTVANPPYGPPPSPSVPDNSFYRGDDAVATVQLGDDLSVTYGVSGRDPAFEKILRSFNIAANASMSPPDQAALDEAYQLATEGLDGLLALQSRLGETANTIERSVDAQIDFQLYAEAMLSDLTEVDVAQASADLSQMQTQLEASYAAIASAQKLSLLDYL